MHRFLALLTRHRGTLALLLGMLIFRSAVADWNLVPTGSMQPTIRIGDGILVDKLAYDLRLPLTHFSLYHRADPRRGDIVVLDSAAARERLVKRVIGLPGDEVALRDNILYIDGHPASYQNRQVSGIHDDIADPARYAEETLGSKRHAIRLSLGHPSPARDFGPVRVPRGEYLLLGDDRDNSADSRYFGCFARSGIIGRARYVALSLDPDRYYLPRIERFGARLD